MAVKFRPVATSNFVNEHNADPVALNMRECHESFRDEVQRLVREMKHVPSYPHTGKPRRRVHHSA